MIRIFEVLKLPVITEKSTHVKENLLTLTFKVARDANKIDVRRAVQELFKVTVTDVRTLVVRGKEKKVGRFIGRRPAWKKAFVTLKPGDNIEFFEGV